MPCKVYWLDVPSELIREEENPKLEFYVNCIREAEESSKREKKYTKSS
ncbi:MAG: hypothetical protein QXV69_09220 [Sulfolobaceae archaeon]